jgi:putative ABC transport system permease protein
VVTKKQEFAMLQSIGMTNAQLMKMIQTEGLSLSIGNLLITLIIGIPASYAGIELLHYFNVDYMHFKFPIWFFLGYVVLIILVPIIVSSVTLHSFKKQTLVERLRIAD